MKFFTTGVMADFPGASTLLMEGLQRQGDPEVRGKLRKSAIATAFSGNGRVIAAYDQDRCIAGWAQLVRIDMLFGPTAVNLCRYWGDDSYITTNMMEALLVEACMVARQEWHAEQLHTLVCQKTILHSFGRMGTAIARVSPQRWHTVIATNGTSAIDERLLPPSTPLLPEILLAEHRWEFVQY